MLLLVEDSRAEPAFGVGKLGGRALSKGLHFVAGLDGPTILRGLGRFFSGKKVVRWRASNAMCRCT